MIFGANIKIDKRITAAYGTVTDPAVKTVLFGEKETLCSFKFLRAHEDAFKKLLPVYFDLLIAESDDTHSAYSYLDRRELAGYMCLELGIVDPTDITTVNNFAAAGISKELLHRHAPKSTVFLKGLGKTFDERTVLDFIEKNPETLLYLLPLLTAVDSELFASAVEHYLTGAGLQDTQRYAMLNAMLMSDNAAMLLKFLDLIDENNLYRLKAFNEVAVSLGNYVVSLTPKELVPVLRAAASGDEDKCLTYDFRHAYYFIHAYDRIKPRVAFKAFAYRLLDNGTPRARQAMLYTLKADAVNGKYASKIFDSKLSAEDLSFFIYSLNGEAMDRSVMPVAFECLYNILCGMDKVSYHYKTDEDIMFARDLTKSHIVLVLSQIAARSDRSYTKRLDALYDTWREEAQARYLQFNEEKTSLDTRACAVRFLKTDNYEAIKYYDEKKIRLTYAEAVEVSDYLKTKKQQVKTKIIKEFLLSDDKKRIAEYLCGCSEDYKKQAGEEMKSSMGKVSESKLEKKTSRFYWNNESVFETVMPKAEVNKLAALKITRKAVPCMKFKRFEEFWGRIEKFRSDNADYEYDIDYGEGKVTLGSKFTTLKRTEFTTGPLTFDRYPLGEGFKKVMTESLTRDELACFLIFMHCCRSRDRDIFVDLCGGDAKKMLKFVEKYDTAYFADNTFMVMFRLFECAVNELTDDGMLCDMIYMFTDKKIISKLKRDDNGYTDSCVPEIFIRALIQSDDKESVRLLLSVMCKFVLADAVKSLPLELLAKAYEYELITEEFMRYFILSNSLGGTFSGDHRSNVMRPGYPNKKFKAGLLKFMDDALENEFRRGVLQTPYTETIMHSNRIFGVKYYVKAVAALRGLTWVRSPYGYEKDATFSAILKITVKAEDDTYERFAELVKQFELTDDELIIATLFNPEFVDWTAKYLNIPGLKTAVFWFVAHLNEVLYGESKDRREQQIKEFSDISYPDFQDGAFDYAWYKEMVGSVPEKELKRIYANAKYVTVGGLHKRAQRFFDAVGGRIEKSECLEKINTTRNKDYCLIYSLIPVKDKADLFERYEVLSEFVRQSKQFGAQRQASERRTVDIAFENLARAAGYNDPDVFIFEMEAQNPSDIFKPYTIGDITVTPYIDGNKFKAALAVEKDGKALSAVPSKYGKDKTLVALRDEVRALNKKLSRIKHSLENCMNTRVEFTAEQIKSMCREKTIAAVLEKLVLLSDGKLALVKDGVIVDLHGNATGADRAVVAHPATLKANGLLSDAVSYIVKNNVVQPFKQVLREIYMMSEQEKQQDEVLRFKGYNVDLKKCVAALKGKGWGVSEDIRLRKVYYKADTVAAIFREFDCFYTVDYENVNRELHGVFFLKRKSGEIIPLKDVDEITFSETLRDVDLMITISSVSVYDFELAMSTVEIRHEILKSIVEILKLDNVSLLKDNIKVQGRYGTYIINIRTGLVFKEGKGNLLLETVYSVDKPILLDFIDEDPMTADIISKAVVLAADEKITDPKILFQIKD